MLAVAETIIRTSFINASRKTVQDMTLPESFHALTENDWHKLSYFGWRDPKYAKRAYVLLPRLDEAPVAVALQQAEAVPRSRAMCNWCRDIRLPNDVVFWGAKRVGEAGRRGNTVGTLICRDFECSQNVRNDPPPAYEGYDVAAARIRRLDDLQLRVEGFADMLISGR